MAVKLQTIDLRIEFVGSDEMRSTISDDADRAVRKTLAHQFSYGAITEPHTEEINFELNDRREPAAVNFGVEEEAPR